MKINCLLMLFLLVAGLINGCGRSGGEGNSEGKSRADTALMDSLKKMDSLVNANKVMNHGLAKGMAHKALSMAKKSGFGEALVKAYLMMGVASMGFRNDSAFFYYSAGLRISDSIGCDSFKASLMYNLANIYQEASDTKTSLNYFDSVVRLGYHLKNYVFVSNAYNALGNLKLNLVDSNGSVRMYDSALAIGRRYNHRLQTSVALVSLSRFTKDQKESIRLKREALKALATIPGTEEEQAAIMVNIGMHFGIADSSIKYNQAAIRLAQVLPMSEVIIAANNNLAYDYMDRKEFPEAEVCLRIHAVPMAEKTGNIDWLSNLYDTWSDLYIKQGRYKEAFEAERKALNLRIKSSGTQAASQLRLLSAMLDVRNNEIRLQAKEKVIQKKEDRIRWIILWFSVAVLLMFAGILLIQWRLQKNKLRYQNQMLSSANKIIEAEENEKARLGRDFHDITGQKFTSLSAYIETLDIPDLEKKERALEMLGEIGESVRKMSHRMNRTWLERFSLEDSLSGLCKDFIKLTGLDLEFHQPSPYPKISKETSIHLFRIVQELLTNAVKHAEGSKVSLSIAAENSSLVVKYSDNGPGFDLKSASGKGMGLSNLNERVILLGGSIETDSRPGFGTFCQITIPLVLQ